MDDSIKIAELLETQVYLVELLEQQTIKQKK